jgi:ribosomal protein L29
MNTHLNMEETLRDASDEELRNFILETLIELLDLAMLLSEKKIPTRMVFTNISHPADLANLLSPAFRANR